MKFKTYRNSYSLLLVSILIIIACAKVQAPTGGPEDKSQPGIISVKPQTNSVNVPLDTELEVIFSKNMNKAVTEKAVFISPLFFDYPEFSWSGKKLKIKLPEKLKPNTTHVLTIGAAAQDNRGNKLGQTISSSFSTGETISMGSVFGKVLSTDTRKLNIWAYRLESGRLDTFWMELPDFVTQPDSFGEFRFEYLSHGDYLVVAVDDKNDDQFWAPPGEKLALPDTLVTLNDNQQEFGPLVMMPVDRDTLQPYLSGVISPDNRTIRIEFSQRMDSAFVLLPESYRINIATDSLSKIEIDDIFPLTDDMNAVLIRCSEMIPDEKYKIEAVNLKSYYDIFADSLSRLFNAGGIDTSGPEITGIEPNPSREPRLAGFDIKLTFSELIDTGQFSSAISFSDTLDNPIDFELAWQYPHQLILKPAFKNGEVYHFSYDARRIFDLVGNQAGDTVYTYEYFTASPDSFGQIVGQVVNAPGQQVVVIAQPEQGDFRRVEAEENGSFAFINLPPEKYILRAFYDSNKNGWFDGGRIKPFEFAEPIAIYTDTVSVRARWETDIGQLDFKSASK
ncbi:MAG: hypothetical protein GY839_03345 [candidate division Zixibacteria bacterium]|nr:hypothetical protein [candidate division Zixibacteria bacterium]